MGMREMNEMNSKQRCLAAIQGESVDRCPVFPLLMFFAQKRLGVSYREFALHYEQRVVAAIHAAGGLTKLHICGNTTHLLCDMIRCGADLFNVDHLVDFQTACDVYGQHNLCFKGNLDPVTDMLQSTPKECEKHCFDRLNMAKGLKFMLSPGCEVPAETSDEVFRVFCEAPQRI